MRSHPHPRPRSNVYNLLRPLSPWRPEQRPPLKACEPILCETSAGPARKAAPLCLLAIDINTHLALSTAGQARQTPTRPPDPLPLSLSHPPTPLARVTRPRQHPAASALAPPVTLTESSPVPLFIYFARASCPYGSSLSPIFMVSRTLPPALVDRPETSARRSAACRYWIDTGDIGPGGRG